MFPSDFFMYHPHPQNILRSCRFIVNVFQYNVMGNEYAEGERISAPYDGLSNVAVPHNCISAGNPEEITQGPETYVSSIRTVALWVSASQLTVCYVLISCFCYWLE